MPNRTEAKPVSELTFAFTSWRKTDYDSSFWYLSDTHAH